MIYNSLKILFSKKELFKLYIILFGCIISSIFEVIGIGSIPVFVMMITDVNSLNTYLPNFISSDWLLELENNKIVLIGASLLGLIFIIKNLYLMLLFYVQGKFIIDLRYSLTNKIFKYYVNLPYDEHSNLNPGIIIRSVQADISNTFTLILSYISLIKESLMLVAVFSLLILTDLYISIFTLTVLGLPVIVFYYTYSNVLKRRGKIITNEIGKKNIIVEQSLGAIKETKILKREDYFINIFSKINSKIEKISFFSYMVNVTPRLFLEVVALSTVAAIATLLTLLERPSGTIIPMITLLAISAVRLIPGINLITASLTNIGFMQPPFDLILQIVKKMNLSNKKNLDNSFESNNKEAKIFKKNITFKNIFYNYIGSEKKAVKDVNIEILKGSSVGIIGRSGAGKSTLVDIILGLLKPISGDVVIDGIKVTKEKDIWQTQIGYVPQNIYLLDDTIKKNIIFGINEEDVDEHLLAEVVKAAQLKELVDSLPENIDTIVGNRGAKLSGGERQRIGIARALYNQPKIMVLDEATSSLDIDNENKILGEIYENKKDKTLIIISHRNNTVKYCDSIYVMEGGKIIDNGSFREIMKKYNYLSEDLIK